MTRRAGLRQERLVIQSRGGTINSHGATPLTPTTIATVWARVTLDADGTESKAAGQITGGTMYIVETDYNTTTSAITTKHQATWRGKTLDIGAVDLSGVHRGVLTLSCAEVAA